MIGVLIIFLNSLVFQVHPAVFRRFALSSNPSSMSELFVTDPHGLSRHQVRHHGDGIHEGDGTHGVNVIKLFCSSLTKRLSST